MAQAESYSDSVQEIYRLFKLARYGRLLEEKEDPWLSESPVLGAAIDTAEAAGMDRLLALMFACVKQHRALSEHMRDIAKLCAAQPAPVSGVLQVTYTQALAKLDTILELRREVRESSKAPDTVDHRKLLEKYVRWIIDQEGTDYIKDSYAEYRSHVAFTDEEWQELERLADAAWKEDE